MYYVQYISAVCAGLAVACTSIHVLWPSVGIKKILAGNSPIPKELTGDDISWIVMSLFLGTIPGAMISGWMLTKIGRKKSLLILTMTLFLLWIPIAFTSSVWLLCLERFTAGVAISALIIVVTLYNGEIANKDIRGRLGTTLNGFSSLGEFVVACIGPLLTYQRLAFVNCVLPLISVVLIYFIPESPYYLVQIGKKEEAKVHLKHLMARSNHQANINTAISNIEKTVNMERENKSSFWAFITEPKYRSSLVIMFVIKLLQQLSGNSAFGEFTGKIMEISHSKLSREEWKMILTAIPLLGVAACGLLVDKIGRKAILIISLIGCAITLITEGVCCTLLEHFERDIDHLTWLATGSLVVYLVMRALGIGTLPYVIMGELFATNIKHHAVTFCGTINAITGFIMLKYFDRVNSVHALYVTFWIFAGICIIGSVYVYFVMPETKCKTFDEIQENLSNVNRKKYSKARPV